MGTDINLIDKGDTNNELHNAIITGDALYAEGLINVGADINITNKEGRSPLILASEIVWH
jgi:ankyrin repeat protein